jgi:signal transduction histidine kinase
MAPWGPALASRVHGVPPPLSRAEESRPRSPFEHLERQARLLQWLLIGLVIVIAVLPGALSVFLEISHVRLHTRHEAQELAAVVTSELHRLGPDLSEAATPLKVKMQDDGVVALQVIGPDRTERLRLGEPRPSIFAVSVELPLHADGTRLGSVRVQAEDGLLVQQAARVFAIHAAVAGLLALLLYRVPMRALHRAIGEAHDTYAQLIHADKLSSIGEMYAGLAHEINNPLGIILSRVRFLLGASGDRKPPPALVPDLEMIDRHGTRIAEIVRSLLAFARKTGFELGATDLNRVIADVVALVERPLAKARIRMEVHLSPLLPPIQGSHDHLQQVFLNLLNNARDAMPEGGTVTVRTMRDGTRALAEVSDTGTGMTPEIRDRIFDPFFTTKDVGKGTGLGLTVSYGIVRAHGGDIEVETSPGRGTLFRLVFPLRG